MAKNLKYTIKNTVPVNKFDQKEVEEIMLLDFINTLCEKRILKYTTKVDSDGFMSIDFELTASKLE